MIKIKNDKAITAFGLRVKSIRELKKLSQEDLAIDSDVPLSQIGRIERGEVNLTISSMYAIAKGLNVEVKIFFDGSDVNELLPLEK